MKDHDSNRILKRVKFIKKNYALCCRAFRIKDIAHKDWKKFHGRKLVEKARRKIGYSNTTANCDIFWSLRGLWIWYTNNIL